MGSGEVTNEQIFEIADKYGWMDDFNRWNFQGDTALLEFADAIIAAVKGRREWVSLTDTEMCECYNSQSIGYAIEAKLKEKTT
jgi:hypothetical protein